MGTEIHEPYGEKASSGDADFNFKCQPCEGEKIKVFGIFKQTKWFIFD